MKNKIGKQSAGFLKNVKETIAHYGMLEKGDRVLAAVSGGADSVSLLLSLVALRRNLGIETAAANLDHGVRGNESASESVFVESLARDIEVEYIHEKLVDVSGNPDKRSLEEKLRKKRYEFFVKAAKKLGCNVIATGHNMDDQAETVVMRVIKGSSASGLGGIPPVRDEKGIRIIRPLIRTSRIDIEKFIRSSGKSNVEDSSNEDKRFLRNRVRLEVLPYLEKINPSVRMALVNIADSVREETTLSEDVRGERAGKIISRGGSGSFVLLKDYLASEPVVRRQVFKMLFTHAGGSVKKLSYRHWILMDRFARTQSKARSLDFPGNVQVVKDKGKLVFRYSTS
jgi:tRNA(Ile)-lysidine synthase